MSRQPGITFEAETPSRPDPLPRMDVAAFVGFATRGPIDVPVPVDDFERFRDVFGPPLTLVRDADTGRTTTAYLDRAVEAFFRNGGRRCWVVRVAQSPNDVVSDGPIERTSFGLPGLVNAETGEPSTVRARCFGATFDTLRVGTVLRRHLLPDPTVERLSEDDSSSDALRLSWPPALPDSAVEDQLVEGDLMRFAFERLRVLVDANDEPIDDAGTLFALDVTLRHAMPDPVPLRFDAFRLFDTDGNDIESTVGGGGEGVSLIHGTVQGDEGEAIQIPVEVAAPTESIASYEFVLPADIRSLIEVHGLITGTDAGMETPAAAEVHQERHDGRLLAFASVFAPPTMGAREAAGPTSGTTVRVGPLHFFTRAPDSLVGSEEQIEVDVDVKSLVDFAEETAESPAHTFAVRRSSSVLDQPRYQFVISTDEESTDGTVDPTDVEEQFVHVKQDVDGLNGWLQLGRVARRYETDTGDKVVEVNVIDALWQTGSPETIEDESLPPIHGVERQRFDLLVWEGQALRVRLDNLGFTASHPRGWMTLPVDEELFEVQDGNPVVPDTDTLNAEVFEPRFPIAGPNIAESTPFVPLGMSDRPEVERTRGRVLRPDGPDRLERELLGEFSPELFFDASLEGESTANLAEEADDMMYIREEPASGIHSLWPIDEVALLSVPDAMQYGWEEPAPVLPTHASTPVLDELERHPEADPPYVRLEWNGAPLQEGDVEVEVQEAETSDFVDAVTLYRGSEKSVERYVRRADPITLFIRYRLVVAGRPGAWSNTRSITFPDPDFDPCQGRPEVPALRLSGQNWLSWDDQSDSFGASVEYVLHIDETPTFDTPVRRTLNSCLGPPDLDDEELPANPEERCWYELDRSAGTPAVQYVRVRARVERDGRTLAGGWSQTVAVVRPLEREVQFISKADYNNPSSLAAGGGRQGLLTVHRAMLRFGAARGDVFSVLSLPQDDEPDEATHHVDRLRTPGGLLQYDEDRTLSYGALYHPWLLGPVSDGERIAPIPPDGAACGMIANRTLRDGAWMAPANLVLVGAQTVTPSLSSAEQTALEPSAINAFVDASRGVLTLGTTTLSRNPDLEPISTRRLLILVRRLVRREGPALVFENHTPELRRRLAEQFDEVLRRLYRRGAFAGTTPTEGYRVVADEGVNPRRQVERGRLVVELRLAPARPLKFLTVRLVQRNGQGPVVTESAIPVPA